EDAVDVRPETGLVSLPRFSVRHGAHARAHDVAVREHHLHAAVRFEVVAILKARVARAAIERVAHDAAPAGIGHVRPQANLLLLQVPIQIEVADAGLYQAEGLLLVHLEHAVHALQIEHHAAGVHGRRAP